MSRITQVIAENSAEKLVEKKTFAVQKMKEELKTMIHNLAVSEVPVEIVKLWKSKKDWVKSTNYLYLHGPGLNHHYTECGYYPSKNGSPISLVVEKDIAKNIVSLIDRIEKGKKERDTLYIEIKNTLLALKTYKNIEKEFVEAFKLLPPDKVSTSLMINVSAIREKLK